MVTVLAEALHALGAGATTNPYNAALLAVVWPPNRMPGNLPNLTDVFQTFGYMGSGTIVTPDVCALILSL